MPSSVNGGEATRDSLWRTCWQVYGELAMDAGLPGAEALVKGGVLRRLLWTGALLTLVYYSASEMYATLSEYFAYSVAIAFEYNTNESLQMPDVTVCNLNPLRRSRYCARNASERVMNSELNRRICGKKQDFKELAQTGLPEPYANPCQSTWPSRLMVHMDQMYGVYTREYCLVMCLQVKVVEACECLLVYLPQIFTLAQRYDTCADKSGDISYKRDVTVTKLREDLAGPTNEDGPPARLVVYFKSLTYDHTLSVPKYDETNVLGSLGGIIGMYLGLSFLVLFQVIDVLVVGTLRLCKTLR
ncbi:hypothetical protein HPB52_002156 [Rhipicephalus sanguineus]|uniref:Uncharacterized protein n=1 Tax=Rhipicephalus sanguineus TaxID=34632 RepID=A0A9D4Q460_RHISA|nr:hypothetical protein HPB52_002156 [Rhipicephalus sanguineus]